MSPYFVTVEEAYQLLSEGQIVAIPTETVYGLAGDATDPLAIEKIYKTKRRPLENPLIIHYASSKEVLQDVVWTDSAEKLAKAFWPGPLTLVLERSFHCRIASEASAGFSSLAVRVPAHPLLSSLLEQYPHPLAAPSANLAGKLSPTCPEHVLRYFQNTLPILEGGICAHGLESTIIDARGMPSLLREGALCRSLIEAVLNCSLKEATHKEAPGMSSSHYCPLKPLRKDADFVSEEEGLLAFGPPLSGACHVVQLSLSKNLTEAAACFFEALHILDQGPCQRIAVMPIPDEGIGRALNDRLSRAATPSIS